MAVYPEAAAAQPSPPPAPRAIPYDIAAAFELCLRAGLYGEAEPALLPALVAADADATRALINDMASRDLPGELRTTGYLRMAASGLMES